MVNGTKVYANKERGNNYNFEYPKMKKDKTFNWCIAGLLFLVLMAYSNHFTNSFHFDDMHTIVNNSYIRSLKNIPSFFKSAQTFSSLPANQSYRPMLTTLYALDYAMGGFNPVFYHVPVFLFFLLQGFCLYFLLIKVFNSTAEQPANKYFALFATGWYMVATINSSVINYTSSSSDSISTCWLMLGMVLYVYKPGLRKWYLYIVPVAIGFLFKPTVIVFPVLLVLYTILFESKEGTLFNKIKGSLVPVLPVLVVCLGLYELQSKLGSTTFVTGGVFYNYTITQPFVALYYFLTYFFPFGVSADSDWIPLASVVDWRFLMGILFLIAIVTICIRLFKRPTYAPVLFGLAWFIIALLPTSLIPLAEVVNDHRAFFPYIGLVMATGWLIALAWQSWGNKLATVFKTALVVIVLLNAAGTYSRNMVWHTEESLWKDVIEKSPRNGRAIMNYGLTLMNKGDYAAAEIYYRKAITLMPYYAYAYGNLAIDKYAQLQYDTAEHYYKLALKYGPDVPSLSYFYAKYLHERGRNADAIPLLKKVLSISSADISSAYMLMAIYQDEEDWHELKTLANETLQLLPEDAIAKQYLANAENRKGKLEEQKARVKQNPTPENYLDLSLLYYNKKMYKNCIDACREAVKLKPGYDAAYNNIGSAYNMMGEWQKAMDAFEQALKTNSNYTLARNNYLYAHQQLVLTDSLIAIAEKQKTPEAYLNLSLLYYNQGLYENAIGACKQSLKLNPKYVLAYNNMCASYNKMNMWDSALYTGKQALKLDPSNALIKNNLAEAQNSKAQ